MLVLLVAAVTTGGVTLHYARDSVGVFGGPVYWVCSALLWGGFAVGAVHASGAPRRRRWAGLVLVGIGLLAVVFCVLVATRPSTASDQPLVLVYSAISPLAWVSAGAIALFDSTTSRSQQ